jgi:hypothetical protein
MHQQLLWLNQRKSQQTAVLIHYKNVPVTVI